MTYFGIIYNSYRSPSSKKKKFEYKFNTLYLKTTKTHSPSLPLSLSLSLLSTCLYTHMAEEELCEWSRRYENDAVDKLFVNDPPLVFLPQEQHHRLMPNEDFITNKLVSSTLYSGPRIQDIANAMALVEPLNHPVQKRFNST